MEDSSVTFPNNLVTSYFLKKYFKIALYLWKTHLWHFQYFCNTVVLKKYFWFELQLFMFDRPDVSECSCYIVVEKNPILNLKLNYLWQIDLWFFTILLWYRSFKKVIFQIQNFNMLWKMDLWLFPIFLLYVFLKKLKIFEI